MGEKIYSFNPTLVRLRLFRALALELHRMPFQSHAGSIEAQAKQARCCGSNRMFQSHAGSIEAN